jgi:predicted alpha/beta-hydrolase family hydrolase
MRHPTMEALSDHLGQVGIATLRYQFLYMERGSGPPDPQPVLTAMVRAAVLAAAGAAPDLPLFAGGKSMGGRMTSLAAAEAPLPGVHGIIFFGFPLHPAGRSGTSRAKHLAQVTVPMLFLQGTRDKLAELDLIQPMCAGLGSNATLHFLDGADHSFQVLKRSGRSNEDVLIEIAGVVGTWTSMHMG